MKRNLMEHPLWLRVLLRATIIITVVAAVVFCQWTLLDFFAFYFGAIKTVLVALVLWLVVVCITASFYEIKREQEHDQRP